MNDGEVRYANNRTYRRSIDVSMSVQHLGVLKKEREVLKVTGDAIAENYA